MWQRTNNGNDEEENLAPMGYHTLQCAGVKVFEFFPKTNSGHVGSFLLFVMGY
jgi:hypothetical protein